MPKSIYTTSQALQPGSTGDRDTGACGSHQEEHQPLGQPNSSGTQEISTLVKPQDGECVWISEKLMNYSQKHKG